MSVMDVLNDEVAQELLHSQELAKLAYNWTDGTPRVVPIWFHWDGQEIVMGTPGARYDQAGAQLSKAVEAARELRYA